MPLAATSSREVKEQTNKKNYAKRKPTYYITIYKNFASVFFFHFYFLKFYQHVQYARLCIAMDFFSFSQNHSLSHTQNRQGKMCITPNNNGNIYIGPK